MKLVPPFNWLYAGWMKFSHALGFVMSKIILTILWIVGFGIYAIVMKIGMLFRSKKVPETYWKDAEPQIENPLKYQF